MCKFVLLIFLLQIPLAVQASSRCVKELGKSVVAKKKKGQILVTRKGAGQAGYVQTNRGLKKILANEFYPSSFLIKAFLKSKTIADLGCGPGEFVKDLNALGAKAVGVDIFLEPALRNDAAFVEGDMTNLSISSRSVEVVFSTYAYFSYATLDQADLIERAFNEAIRILKPGGWLLVSPVTNVAVRFLLRDLARANKNVEILSIPPEDASYGKAFILQKRK